MPGHSQPPSCCVSMLGITPVVYPGHVAWCASGSMKHGLYGIGGKKGSFLRWRCARSSKATRTPTANADAPIILSHLKRRAHNAMGICSSKTAEAGPTPTPAPTPVLAPHATPPVDLGAVQLATNLPPLEDAVLGD